MECCGTSMKLEPDLIHVLAAIKSPFLTSLSLMLLRNLKKKEKA